MNFFLTIVLDGLIQASWLFVVALGLTLVFGVLKILNIAHGSFYALGAYIAATAVTTFAAHSLPPSLGFVAMLVSVPGVRRAMTPRFLKAHRVRQVARHHFTASGARVSDAEPHILIFASLQDRQVELVAHKAIHDAVGDGPWNAAVQAVAEGMKEKKPAEGFIRAIKICGEALAAHFPANGPHQNFFPDDILET